MDSQGLVKSFYIASSFNNKVPVRQLAKELVDMGLEWEHDWTTHERVQPTDEQLAREYAELDIKAASSASIFILLQPGDSGAHTELGAALSSPAVQQIYIIGPDRKMFYYHSKVQYFKSKELFLSFIGK